MLHERWWRDALPGLPVWDRIRKSTTGIPVVEMLELDPADIGAKKALQLSITVVNVAPRVP
jgi:hypothetical protein